VAFIEESLIEMYLVGVSVRRVEETSSSVPPPWIAFATVLIALCSMAKVTAHPDPWKISLHTTHK